MVSLVCDGVVSCHKCREWVMHESRSQVLLNTHTCHTTFATKHTCIWFQVFFICVLLLPDRSFKNLGCHCTSVSYIIHDLSINIYACIFHHMELIVRGGTNICWVFLGGGGGGYGHFFVFQLLFHSDRHNLSEVLGCFPLKILLQDGVKEGVRRSWQDLVPWICTSYVWNIHTFSTWFYLHYTTLSSPVGVMNYKW